MSAASPYSFRKSPETHFLSLRIQRPFWEQLEAVAAREFASMNTLVNTLLQLALEDHDTPEGRQRLHELCAQNRTRWERKVTMRRRRRATETE